jgi:hypothetical protein
LPVTDPMLGWRESQDGQEAFSAHGQDGQEAFSALAQDGQEAFSAFAQPVDQTDRRGMG